MSERKRGKGAEATARAGALERLKVLRSCGRRSEVGGFQVRLEAPIYDTVDDDQYKELVAKRQEETHGFIVDDDGLGYCDEGEEEDWSKADMSPSSDESGQKPKRKKADPSQQKPKKASSSLLAAGAMMGKQRLPLLFTKSVFRTSGDDKLKSLSCDSIVDEVIAEFAPNEADREMRKHSQGIADANTSLPVNVVRGENRTAQSLSLSASNHVSEIEDKVPNQESIGMSELKSETGSELVKPSLIPRGAVEEKQHASAQGKREPVSVNDAFSLNVKASEPKDPALSAIAGWKAVMSGAAAALEDEGSNSSRCQQKLDFKLNEDGSLPFYILDAYEEFYGANMGTLYLFGKVKAGNRFHSCCVVVKNMFRCVYAIPNGSLFDADEIIKLEKAVKDSEISLTEFHTKLQDAASGLKNEVVKQLLDINVSTFRMAPVKRNYAFERSDIPKGENYVLKISYPFKDPPLPADLKGETFSAMLGTHSSALELFLVKRKIKGPSWLSISNFSSASQLVSWCKFEVIVDSVKEIRVTNSTLESPPVVVAAINLKTVINEQQNVNEIVSASIICCHKAKIHTPMLASEWKIPGMLSHFSVVRKLEGIIFPMGFNKEVTNRNTRAGSNVISVLSSEKALLNRLMMELHELDSDVLVGHNISGFDLDVLLHRFQVCNVRSNLWSRIGRLKRSVMPRLTKGSTIFGRGASPAIMSCIAGRLLCDTYLCSRDLLKEVSYSLTQLAKTQLNKDRKEIAPHDIPRMFQSTESLVELIECGETDAWLSMELMFYLSVLPLTRQLTNISGNLWGKTLQGARAQRVEYLLLHAFHANKYMVPDKFSSYAKETKTTKRNHGAEDLNVNELDIDDPSPKSNGKSRKGPAYSGGLVLEPKRGLYDKYILLLDFNSLYPSIIQEFNICFTTVQRSLDELGTHLPSSSTTPGVLPELLKNLVERRRVVKRSMKTATGIELQQYDIRQQALKLTANSMYGCLGFSSSRFYAKPLAELITLQGREILQSTVDLVQNYLNLEVIYDSIMVYSGLDDIAKAKEIARKVILEVNKKYKCLEIDLDAVYKRMLLLNKKKYAAVKVQQSKDGKPYEVIERKGLDMVRRDWSLLSKELGDFCLSQILSGGSCEDVVESIHNALMKVQEDIRNGQVALEKYVITKTLTKPPEAYPDAKNQPHVLVAKRLKQSGYSTGCSVGDTVPYVICCEQGTLSGNSTGIAQRARHPDELTNEDGKWMIDIDYYLSQQIHPVVSRLCASVQGTSPERLADCLGLDSAKFQSKSNEAARNDPSSSLLFAVDDEERYRGCEPLKITCPSCSGSFDCPSVSSFVCKSINDKVTKPEVEEPSSNFWVTLCCPKCPGVGRISPAMIANQVKRQADSFVSTYYKGQMMCDDETCNFTNRSLNLQLIGDSERGTVCLNYPQCNGRLVRKYTEAELYKQLSYFCYLLDTVRCMEKIEGGKRVAVEKDLSRIKGKVDLAASTVERIKDRCAYGWVQLKDLFIN